MIIIREWHMLFDTFLARIINKKCANLSKNPLVTKFNETVILHKY